MACYGLLQGMILDKFPSVTEFYQTYWNQKPFVVRGGVDASIFQDLIDGNSLAALSLEEDVKSRIVFSSPEGDKWSCEHGPFDEDYFSTLDETHWNLLVQNVEQYHTDTAKLLQKFHFAPRWLMDDIMVGYSAEGGSVGPHTDSYHVFLVQGQGRRQWTIGREVLIKGDCIEGLELKVLKKHVDGESVEVAMGDVIYIPPNFAHEGITLEEAITFSIGFLGPQMSDLMIEYGHYLSEQSDGVNKRYSGEGMTAQSGAFIISTDDQSTIQNNLTNAIKSDDFATWLAQYFSTPTYDDVENIEARENQLSSSDLFEAIRNGQNLYKPEHIKLAITHSPDGGLNLAVYGEVIETLPVQDKLIHLLNDGKILNAQDIDALGGEGNLSNIVTFLYNRNVLFFEDEDLTTS